MIDAGELRGTLFAAGIYERDRACGRRVFCAIANAGRSWRGRDESGGIFCAHHAAKFCRRRWSTSGWWAFAMLLAMAVGVPLGILVTRRPWLVEADSGRREYCGDDSEPGAVWIFAAGPWLGDRADRLAIVALALYALLPIIRNTAAGISGVDGAVREAARGMGMTDAADSAAGGVAAFTFHDDCGNSRGDGADDRDRDDCRGGGRGRTGRIYFSRAGDGEQSIDSGGRDSRGFAGVGCGFSDWACWSGDCSPRDR